MLLNIIKSHIQESVLMNLVKMRCKFWPIRDIIFKKFSYFSTCPTKNNLANFSSFFVQILLKIKKDQKNKPSQRFSSVNKQKRQTFVEYRFVALDPALLFCREADFLKNLG